jgi:hypothetical protein
VQSGNPPSPTVKYQIELSRGGKSWKPIIKDWTIPRRGDEPGDFWSQSLCWGRAEPAGKPFARVRVRFRNNGGKPYARAEVHLIYGTASADRTRVTFHWTDDAGPHQATHSFSGAKPTDWEVATGANVRTDWVEFEPTAGK